MFKIMKTISIQDLRQHWPEVEAALQAEGEIIVTRDSKPVAKLVCASNEETRRPRWDAKAHARSQKKISGGKISRSDASPAESRADRISTKKRKRWNPEEHKKWLKKVWGNKMMPNSDAIWKYARADRWERKSI
jgi:antitoxin (DNA-binding transcriptional repressor) of toxin-antitoxin stability system